jgi:hypothetical protein
MTPAIARITRMTQGIAPCGAGAFCLFALAGLNLAINAMVAPGVVISPNLGFAGETSGAEHDFV